MKLRTDEQGQTHVLCPSPKYRLPRWLRFSPAARTIIAVVILAYLFVDKAAWTVIEAPPSGDEMTWTQRSMFRWWFAQERVVKYRYPDDYAYFIEYYWCIHHPSVTRIIYGTTLRLAGVTEMPKREYDKNLSWQENLDRGNYLPLGIRVTLRAVNGAFALGAILIIFFALLRISGNRAFSVFAVLPIVYEPTVVGFQNSVVGYIGTDAILLFMTTLFWLVWLLVKERGARGAVLLGLVGGVAVSTKYTAGLLLVASTAYFVVKERGARRMVLPAVSCGAGIAVFLALNPVYLGGGCAWAWHVLVDTFRWMALLQANTLNNPFYKEWLISRRGELTLMLFPYLPFLLPVAALLVSARRAAWFGATATWSGIILISGIVCYVLFLPTYAAPGRVVFLVILAAAALSRINDLKSESQPAPARASTAVEPDESMGHWLLWVLVFAAAIAGLYIRTLPMQVLVAAAVAALFAGAMLILESPFASAAVVLPVALMAPWKRCPGADAMAALAFSAAVFWLLCIYIMKPGGRKQAAAVALASTVALSVYSGGYIFAVCAAAGVLLSNWRGRWRLALAIVAPLAIIACAGLYTRWLLTICYHQELAPSLEPWASWWSASSWSMPEWSRVSHTVPYNWQGMKFNESMCWQVGAPLAVLAYQWRKSWWFWGTFGGGALVTVATIVLGREGVLQYSLPMEAGMLTPLGVSAVMTLREQWRKRREETGPCAVVGRG